MLAKSGWGRSLGVCGTSSLPKEKTSYLNGGKKKRRFTPLWRNDIFKGCILNIQEQLKLHPKPKKYNHSCLWQAVLSENKPKINQAKKHNKQHNPKEVVVTRKTQLQQDRESKQTRKEDNSQSAPNKSAKCGRDIHNAEFPTAQPHNSLVLGEARFVKGRFK